MKYLLSVLFALTLTAFGQTPPSTPPVDMEVLESVVPPSIAHPPAGWQTNYVPSGTWFKFYAYERFETYYDWDTGEESRVLVWKRANFFLPAQTFCIMQLQPDNTWLEVGTVTGPIGYFDLDAKDGDARVLRLQAE
jgi:hypothetical protein